MSLIYGLSGIALNHLDDWNPDYVIRNYETVLQDIPGSIPVSREDAMALVKDLGKDYQYRSHFHPTERTLKIFLKQGSATINLDTGLTLIEVLKRRPVFREVNFLHYNKPKKLWIWFADAFAVALILMAVTGLFMIKGRKGITGRGAWLTALGILIPVLFLLLYL
jgi:hypothetical protein